MTSSVSGATLAFGGGTTNINGTYSATTATSVSGFAAANFNPGATVNSVGALNISAGTATFHTGGLIAPLAFTLSGGTLTGTDPVTVAGQTNWTAGAMTSTGTTTLNGNLNISGNNFHDLTAGRTLNTTATTTMLGAFGGFFRTSGGASINNSGLWQDQSTFNNSITGTQSTFRNTGVYQRSGTATSTIGIPFNNTGTVDIQSGTLRFTGGYTQTAGDTMLNGGALASTTTLNILGGKLSGSGNVTANVSNASEVTPGLSPGILNITGNYTQTTTGALNIEIGGLTAGSQFDRLAISGSATLSGSLNISLIGGFVPVAGDTFQIMTFGSRTGNFTAINGLDLGGGRAFQVNFTSTALTLVTPP